MDGWMDVWSEICKRESLALWKCELFFSFLERRRQWRVEIGKVETLLA